MRRLSIIACATMFVASSAAAESESDRWNLADIYPSVDAWKAEAAKLEGQLKTFAPACKGRMRESAKRLLECLELQSDMSKRYFRLGVYSGEHVSEDTGNAAYLELDQRADVLGNRLNEATAFVDPELLKIGKAKIDAFVKDEPKLAIYRYPIARVLHRAPHTLDDAGEALVAAFGLMDNAGGNAYTILTNADIPWPKVRLSTGEEVTLDASAFTKHRESQVREDRKLVLDSFYGALRTYERTLGVTLYSQLKQDAVYSRVRKYPDSISMALDRNNIPVAVLDTLVREANAGLPTLYRYYRLRARMLGLPKLAVYDIYPPLVKGDYKFPYAEARRIVLEALAPLGDDYVKAMARGLDSRWMDLYPRPRKQSGAHMDGYAYDVHPFVLMNYNDDYESVTTIAHEWGHAMHSYLANRSQPFPTANYATFVAEIASTFNEELLLKRVLRTAESDEERLFYLGNALEQQRGTFFVQSMFAEFEREIHARADRGEPLTGDALTKAYCDLAKRYYGAEEGVVDVDEKYCVGWAYIPHFYNAFYVYQYATSIAASSLFAERVERNEPGALDRYLALLKAGGSDFPYDLVKRAGVDLATPAPYRSLIKRMNDIMDEIEAILAKRKPR